MTKILTVSDELGTIANLMLLKGYNWEKSIAQNNVAYYKWGSSILYYPFTAKIAKSEDVYIVCLLCNVLLICLCTKIVYDILRDAYMLSENNCKWISLVIGFFPAYGLWSKAVWSEMILMTIPWIVLWLGIKNLRAESKGHIIICSIIAAMVSVYAYMCHARGIVYVAALFFVASSWEILRWQGKARGVLFDIKTIVITILVLMIADRYISSFFTMTLWGSLTDNNNSFTNIINSMETLLDAGSGCILSFFNMILGWLFSISTGTFGIAIWGLIYALTCVFKKNKYSENKETMYNFEFFIALYSILIFTFSFCVGLLFFSEVPVEMFVNKEPNRFDKAIYGRYIMHAVPLFIVMVLANINKLRKERGMKSITLIVCLVLDLNFVFFLYPMIKTNTIVAINQIDTLLLPYELTKSVALKGNLNETFLVCLLISIMVRHILIFFIEKHRSEGFYKVVIVLSIFITFYSWKYYIYPTSTYYYNTLHDAKNTLEKCHAISDDEPIYIGIERGIYAGQFMYPDNVVMGIRYLTDQGGIIIDDNIKKYNKADYWRLAEMDDANAVIFYGNEFVKELKAKGIRVVGIEVGNTDK